MSLPAPLRLWGTVGIVACFGLSALALWRGWQPPARWNTPLELIFVVTAAFIATVTVRTLSSEWRLAGRELSYLLNSGITAGDFLRAYGKIPLWNPLMGRGEPLLENPFSYVLNPLMSLPVMLLGGTQGAKTAVAFHAVLMALGGWVWAGAARLNWPSRILLAMLLGGAGSVTGQLADGFFQMGISHTYAVWVFAALTAILADEHPHPRDSILLAVSATLMIFAGTFWYVLPTAITATAMIAFGTRRRAQLHAIAWAALLTVGLAAVRLIPQAAHYNTIVHPLHRALENDLTLIQVFLRLFFVPSLEPQLRMHYILPPLLATVALLGGLNALWRRWRMTAPLLLCSLFYILWAHDNGAVQRGLYDLVPFLREWRFPERMLAAAVPLVAMLLATAFDGLWQQLHIWHMAEAKTTRRGLSGLVIAGVLTLGLAGGVDILYNWERSIGLWPSRSASFAVTVPLRAREPAALLSIETGGFHDYDSLYAVRARAIFGNPDYRPKPLPATIATPDGLTLYAPYALSYWAEVQANFQRHGYRAVPALPNVDSGLWTLYQHPLTVPYSFTVPLATLNDPFARLPLDGAQAVSYWHQLDRILIQAPPTNGDVVLIVQETAYPGWRVAVNGKRVPLESVAGVIGVRLSASSVPLMVEFRYVPVWLYVGAAIMSLSATVVIPILIFVRYD